MSEDRDKDYWLSLDRRVVELDAKVSGIQRDSQRDITQLTQEIKEITNRVNMGLSPSVQKVIQENADSKLSISELGHTLDKAMNEMKSIVRETADLTKLMVQNFQEHKLKPVEEEVGLMKKTFIYGLVGAVVVFVGQKGINLAWDKVAQAVQPAIVQRTP